jgi:hypothetical protein
MNKAPSVKTFLLEEGCLCIKPENRYSSIFWIFLYVFKKKNSVVLKICHEIHSRTAKIPVKVENKIQ